jgi:hypothetical protein
MDCPVCNKQINPYYSEFYRGLHYCLDCINEKKREDIENAKLSKEERRKREYKNYRN